MAEKGVIHEYDVDPAVFEVFHRYLVTFKLDLELLKGRIDILATLYPLAAKNMVGSLCTNLRRYMQMEFDKNNGLSFYEISKADV